MSSQHLADRFRLTHQLLLKLANEASDEELRWVAGPTVPAMGFHLWHCARWADYWAETLGAPGQVWFRNDLGAAWKFPAELGRMETGIEMPEAAAAALPIPDHATLASYMAAAFAEFERQLDLVDDARLVQQVDAHGRGDTIVMESGLLAELAHRNRHLGMVEALRGVRGGRGTVTV